MTVKDLLEKIQEQLKLKTIREDQTVCLPAGWQNRDVYEFHLDRTRDGRVYIVIN